MELDTSFDISSWIIIGCGELGKIACHSIDGKNLAFNGHDKEKWVHSCEISNDGKTLVSTSGDQTIRMWDVQTGNCSGVLNENGPVSDCHISKDGKLIVSCTWNKTVSIWDINLKKCINSHKKHTGPVYGCAITKDNKIVVSGSLDQKLIIWNIKKNEIKICVEHHQSIIWKCIISNDDKYIVSTSSDNTLKLWDINLGTCLKTFNGHTSKVRGCAISKNNDFIVSCSDDTTLRIWDTSTGECRNIINTEHTDRVMGCVISYDENWIASCSWDKTVRIWDVKSFKCVKILNLYIEDDKKTKIEFKLDGVAIFNRSMQYESIKESIITPVILNDEDLNIQTYEITDDPQRFKNSIINTMKNTGSHISETVNSKLQNEKIQIHTTDNRLLSKYKSLKSKYTETEKINEKLKSELEILKEKINKQNFKFSVEIPSEKERFHFNFQMNPNSVDDIKQEIRKCGSIGLQKFRIFYKNKDNELCILNNIKELYQINTIKLEIKYTNEIEIYTKIFQPWHINPDILQPSFDWKKELLLISKDSKDNLISACWNEFEDIVKKLNGSHLNFKSVQRIHNKILQNIFDNSIDIKLKSIQSDPQLFKDTPWENENIDIAKNWRTKIYNKFYEFAMKFDNNKDREGGLHVIPVVAGHKKRDDVLSICNNGYRVVGVTDPGYFGRGMYFTTKMDYAKKYGNFLVISWVIVGNVYPVIEFPKDACKEGFYEKLPTYVKPTLCGQPNKSQKNCKGILTVYDTHYTVVRPFTDEGRQYTNKYVPCEIDRKEFEESFDEVVIFQEAHVLPCFLIEL